MNKMIVSKCVVDAIENLGAHLEIEQDLDGQNEANISFSSPCGQDVNISFAFTPRWEHPEQQEIDQAFSDALLETFDDYDPSQEAYYWLGDDGHGKNGAPDTMGDVYNDFVAVDEKLGKINSAVRHIVYD